MVYVAGTCMNAGKTVAATELVRGLSRAGSGWRRAKLTGVSLMRDVLSMTDAGAIAALTFNDVGVASTHPGVTVATAKGIFNRLAASRPDDDNAIIPEEVILNWFYQLCLSPKDISMFWASENHTTHGESGSEQQQ